MSKTKHNNIMLKGKHQFQFQYKIIYFILNRKNVITLNTIKFFRRMLVYINYVNAKLCIKYITTYLYYYK